MEPLQLPADVAEKYDLVGAPAAKYLLPGYGPIDLAKLSLADAGRLAARGFPFLVEKVASQPELVEGKESPVPPVQNTEPVANPGGAAPAPEAEIKADDGTTEVKAAETVPPAEQQQ